MVSHTLKILQQLLQDFLSVSDHFTTLRRKGLMSVDEKRVPISLSCSKIKLKTFVAESVIGRIGYVE